ncbi:MAG TPA: DMT family transporter [Ferruginibacter sp.]|nr:DMT family transporter [Ferruginibacter sp.]
MTDKAKAHLALLGTNIFFAINYTAVKYLINQGLVKPFGLNLIRVGISAVLLWVVFVFKPVRSGIHKKDYGRFFLCALSGIAINQLLFIKGLSLTYPIHASLLMLTTPILITFIAAWVLKERLNNYKIAGLALGLLGAIVLVTAKEGTGNPGQVLWGDILIILNAISYTIYFILVKPLMKEYNPVIVIRMIFTIGFFMIFPFCWKEFTEVPWQSYDIADYISLGLIVIGGTFLAYLLNVYGIKVLGASMAGTYIYSQPLFAASIAIIFLGEQLSAYKIIAAVMIFLGVFLSNKNNSNS